MFYECSDDAEGGEAEVFEGTGFRSGVKEGVEEEGNVGGEEEGTGVVVGSDALEEGEGVADSIRGVGGEGRRREKWVDGDYLLQQRRHDPWQKQNEGEKLRRQEETRRRTEGMPEDEGEVVPLFSLLAQFEEGSFSRGGTHEIDDEIVDLFVFALS